MDPNLLKHIEYFLEPNSQTGDLESQQQRRFNPPSSSSSTQNLWDIAGLHVDSPLASPSTAPTSLSFEPFGQTTAPATSKPLPTRSQSHQMFGQPSRVILPPRPPKSKSGHERKRTKLSTESTPFDNVDYWIQFDNEEGAAGEGASAELSHQKGREAQQGAQQPQAPSQQQQQQQQRPKLQHSHTSPSTIPTNRNNQRSSQEQQDSRSAAAGPSNSRPLHRALRPEDLMDDEALDYALSEEGDITAEDFGSINLADHMSKVDTMPPPEVPPREGLYSTPLSWEKPQPGLRLDSIMSMQNPQQLNEEEQRRLIAIAMNTGPVMGGLGSGQFGQQPTGSRGYVAGGGLHATLGPSFNLGGGGLGGGMGGFGGLGGLGMGQITDDAPLLRPETPAVARPPQPRLSRTNTEKGEGKGKGKEKESEGGGDDEPPKPKSKSGDRTAHNDIERKYRTNLKDRISELRDAVPALRTIQEGVVDDGDENAPGNRPKVSKGTVLTKATEYINYLEKKNRTIMLQHQHLSRRLAAFEQLLSQTAQPTFQMPNYSRTLFDPRAFC